MKKILLISALTLITLASGCCSKQPLQNTEPTLPPIPQEKIAEAVTGESTDFSTTAVSDDALTKKIKRINKNASVSTSSNPGAKMLFVDLPIKESNSLPENFVEQVEDIIDDADFDETNEFSYFYFSTGTDDNIYISASFKKTDDRIQLDKLNVMDEKYTDATNKAVADSDLFTEGED